MAVTSQIPRRNGWTIAAQTGDRTPDKTQRLLSRAVSDTFAARGVVRRFAVAGLAEATPLFDLPVPRGLGDLPVTGHLRLLGMVPPGLSLGHRFSWLRYPRSRQV